MIEVGGDPVREEGRARLFEHALVKERRPGVRGNGLAEREGGRFCEGQDADGVSDDMVREWRPGHTLQDQRAHDIFPPRLRGCGESVDGCNHPKRKGAAQGPAEDREASGSSGAVLRDRRETALLGKEVDEGGELNTVRLEAVGFPVVSARIQDTDLLSREGSLARVVAAVH